MIVELRFSADWQVSIETQLKELPVCTLRGTKPANDPGKCQDTFCSMGEGSRVAPERSEPLFPPLNEGFSLSDPLKVTKSALENQSAAGSHFSASAFQKQPQV